MYSQMVGWLPVTPPSLALKNKKTTTAQRQKRPKEEEILLDATSKLPCCLLLFLHYALLLLLPSPFFPFVLSLRKKGKRGVLLQTPVPYSYRSRALYRRKYIGMSYRIKTNDRIKQIREKEGIFLSEKKKKRTTFSATSERASSCCLLSLSTFIFQFCFLEELNYSLCLCGEKIERKKQDLLSGVCVCTSCLLAWTDKLKMRLTEKTSWS